jgi:putative tryptophan/tyrosine transport system substrate-binding protein
MPPRAPESARGGGADPVAAGLIVSLARPGGNLTGVGVLTIELMAKRLDLLTELVPRARVVALLLNPQINAAEQVIRDTQEAARTKGVEPHILTAATESEIDGAFASLVQLQAGALVVGADPFFASRLDRIVALASRQAIPAIYEGPEAAEIGGLISYGTNLSAVHRLAGTYAGKILKGARSADLPVQQPTKFELVINLKTAKALGLIIPETLLATADQVIE